MNSKYGDPAMDGPEDVIANCETLPLVIIHYPSRPTLTPEHNSDPSLPGWQRPLPCHVPSHTKRHLTHQEPGLRHYEKAHP
jgi:hypothetical protein